MTHADESKSASEVVEKQLSDDIPTLEAEVAQLSMEREKTMRLIRELLDSEDPKNGVFHANEIFEAQQLKLRLDVDIKFRTNKVNRIRLGMQDEAQVSGGVKNGFLF